MFLHLYYKVQMTTQEALAFFLVKAVSHWKRHRCMTGNLTLEVRLEIKHVRFHCDSPETPLIFKRHL